MQQYPEKLRFALEMSEGWPLRRRGIQSSAHLEKGFGVGPAQGTETRVACQVPLQSLGYRAILWSVAPAPE